MRNNDSKKIIFYISIIILSLIIVGLIGAIIRLINLPAIFITLIIICVLSFYKKSDWLQQNLESIFKIKRTKNSVDLSLISKKKAADKSLKSIDQLINLINDKVKAKALKKKRTGFH